MTYDPVYYMVTGADVGRPELISFQAYSTVRYWWLILFVNKVDDPFFGLSEGQLLTIPNILDVYDFYKKYAIR